MNPVAERRWRELTEGRSVCLVGGHDEINWDVVNQADTVVRVNGHWARQRGRCDVVYFSCAEDAGAEPMFYAESEIWKSLQFVWLNMTHGLFQQWDVFAGVADACAQHFVPTSTYVHGPGQIFDRFTVLQDLPPHHEWSRMFAKQYDFHPLTGVLALKHLALTKAKAIAVEGFSFYQRDDGTLPPDAGRHSIEPNLRALRDVWLDDDRIFLSNRLISLIDHQASVAV